MANWQICRRVHGDMQLHAAVPVHHLQHGGARRPKATARPRSRCASTRAHKDGVSLDGLSFIVMLHSPGAMARGNITVGLIIDERASDEQADAIGAIATGCGRRPDGRARRRWSGKSPAIERRPIQFEIDGLNRAVRAGELVDQACEGLPSAAAPDQAIGVDNVAHPVNTRLSLAKATRSRMHAFGIDWDDSTGTRNGHFAPFAWAG